MRPAILLIACFVMAANADILDEMKTKFTEFKNNVDELARKVADCVEKKVDITVEEIKSHINPQTLAEIQSFFTVCKDEPVVEGKEDNMQKACAFIKEHWVMVQGKFAVVKLLAAEKFDKFKTEISLDFAILKEVAKQKWTDAKAKLQSIKADAKTLWEKISAKFEEGWSKLTEAIKAKVAQWVPEAQAKFAALKEAAKAKWANIKSEAKELAGKAGLKLDEIEAKLQQLKIEAKAKFEEIKASLKAKIADLKPELEKAEAEIADVLDIEKPAF